MRLNRNSGLALLLIIFGGLIVLHYMGFFFGHFFGHLMSWLFPLALVGLGYVGIRGGRKLIGSVIALVGGLLLLGKLSGLIGLVIAVVLIAYGISVLRRRTV
jgi:hypothetical protein